MDKSRLAFVAAFGILMIVAPLELGSAAGGTTFRAACIAIGALALCAGAVQAILDRRRERSREPIPMRRAVRFGSEVAIGLVCAVAIASSRASAVEVVIGALVTAGAVFAIELANAKRTSETTRAPTAVAADGPRAEHREDTGEKARDD